MDDKNNNPGSVQDTQTILDMINTSSELTNEPTGNYRPNDSEMETFVQPTQNGFDDYLENKYMEIRKVGYTDVSTVAKNTGLTEQEVSAMKDHLFLDTHDMSLEGEDYQKYYFQADGDIAYAWQKAQKGELTPEEKE